MNEYRLDAASTITIERVDIRPDQGFGSTSVGIVDSNGPARVFMDDFVVSEGHI